MEYIWLDDKSPILQQVSSSFKSAAILLHPFVQMPTNWTENKKNSPFAHVYPNVEEHLNLGRPVQWNGIMKLTGLCSYKEIAISLMTSISSFTPAFANEEIAKRLNDGLNEDLYFPTEDSISIYLFKNIIQLYKSIGTSTIKYSDPINDVNGSLDISSVTPEFLDNIAMGECIFTDENNEIAFLSVYDSFATIMLYKNKHIDELIQLKFENIICDNNTRIDWYFQD